MYFAPEDTTVIRMVGEGKGTSYPREVEVPETKITPETTIARPEPSQDTIEKVKTDPTPESDAIITAKFIEAIKDAKPAREATEALKHEERQRRAAIYASILQGGEGHQAFEKAKAALAGPLPKGDYELDLQKFGVTPDPSQ